MSLGLPRMVYADGITKKRQTQFGGYNHNLYARDGDLWEMRNLTSDFYPLLSPRRPRYKLRTLEKPNGLYGGDGLYWVDGTQFYADGEVKGTVTDGKKRFATLGAYVIVLPDKVYYNKLTGDFGSLEKEWSGSATFKDGSYAGQTAKQNTIYAEGVDWSAIFREGDAVAISGSSKAENNKTSIIREIDGANLRFYENIFTNNSTAETLTIKRSVPDIDFICENENRLWACAGDTIYASKLGDPFNWNVFDGVATDSWAVDVGSAGDFTGCVSYLGYPCFFKEEHIYKVYGDKPSNYQVMSSASLGTESGSGNSFAIAGETLFYLARTGIVGYTGGMPTNIAAAFGTVRYQNAVGGSDGTKYYVSMKTARGDWRLFVFDTRYNTWHAEDEKQIVSFAWDKELYMLDAEGNMWLNGDARSVPEGATPEETVMSEAEFADFVEDDPNKKGTSKLQIRMELDAGAKVTIAMMFDSDGKWRKVSELSTTIKRSYYLPIIPRRSDHFKIKFTGTGSWKLYSLVRESYSGSEM